MTGYIHSLQSLGTVDGPGVRAVVFASGCPYRCIYCHNPDTWVMTDGKITDTDELAARIKRLYPYIKDGGVTLSGGEPCMQAEFFIELTEKLHAMGLHVALDTSGAVTSEAAMRLVATCDLVLLDLKFTTEDDYLRYTGGHLSGALAILDECERLGKPVRIRQVIVPGLGDTEDNLTATAALLSPYTVVERVELLPFRKLCLEKYTSLGIPFPLADTPAANAREVGELEARLSKMMEKSAKSPDM